MSTSAYILLHIYYKLHVYSYNSCTYFHNFSCKMAFCCVLNAEPETKSFSVLTFIPVTGSWVCSLQQTTSCISKMNIWTLACLPSEGYWKTIWPSQPKAKSDKSTVNLARKYCTLHCNPSVAFTPYGIFPVCSPG